MENNIQVSYFKFLVSVVLFFFAFGLSTYAEDVPVEWDASVAVPVEEAPSEDVSVEDASPTPEPTEFPGVTKEDLEAALSSLVVRIAADQIEQLATPETAIPVPTESPTIWEKDFNEYSPIEGFAFLTFVVVCVVAAFALIKEF